MTPMAVSSGRMSATCRCRSAPCQQLPLGLCWRRTCWPCCSSPLAATTLLFPRRQGQITARLLAQPRGLRSLRRLSPSREEVVRRLAWGVSTPDPTPCRHRLRRALAGCSPGSRSNGSHDAGGDTEPRTTRWSHPLAGGGQRRLSVGGQWEVPAPERLPPAPTRPRTSSGLPPGSTSIILLL